MWEVILGNSGRRVEKWDKEGGVIKASYHCGQLVQDPTEEIQDRAKSMPGVFYDWGARDIRYLTISPSVIGWGLLLLGALAIPHLSLSGDWVPASRRKACRQRAAGVAIKITCCADEQWRLWASGAVVIFMVDLEVCLKSIKIHPLSYSPYRTRIWSFQVFSGLRCCKPRCKRPDKEKAGPQM